VLSALTSEKGHSLVSLAVSVAARTSTRTYCECVERSAAAAKASEEATGVLADTLVQQVLRFACTPEGERLCMMGVTNFVTNATSVYCENLEGTNFWSDLFAAMVKPEHKQVAGHMTRCFVNELANTVRRPAPSIRSVTACACQFPCITLQIALGLICCSMCTLMQCSTWLAHV